MNDTLPAPYSPAASNALDILLDDRLFARVEIIAEKMSKADGVTPPHLLGKPAACFAVVTTAVNWRHNPFSVAQCTYQTPGGRIGYEGKLCQAILEATQKIEGPVRYTHFGDWKRVQGKFVITKSEKGRDYAKATWTRADAEGLGVTVSAKVKGELEDREFIFHLVQAFPLNSTLWATDPKTQICYTAVRRFVAVAAPGLFMGVPFDHEAMPEDTARDVTPRPRREEPASFADIKEPPAKGLYDPETGEVLDNSATTTADAGAAAPDSRQPPAPTPSEAAADGNMDDAQAI